jgi:autotransporter-associated beta strand protein
MRITSHLHLLMALFFLASSAASWAQVNLLPNGSFERRASNGIPARWTSGYGGVASVVSGVSTRCGDQVLQLVDSSTNTSAGLFSDYIAVVPSDAYTAEAYIMRTDTNLNFASLYIKYYDSANAEVGTFSRSSSDDANVWDYVSVTGAAPTNAVTARVLCYSLVASIGTMYFDGVSFRRAAIPPPANQIAQYVSPSGIGDGSQTANPARYNDSAFWDSVRTNLAINPVKVTFLTGEYLINTDADCLLVTNLGNATNLLTLEGQHPFGSVFTRDNSAQTAAANDPTASGRLQMVTLRWVTNVVVRHLHWENDTTQPNKLAGYSLVVQSGATGAPTENVSIEGCSFVGLGPNYYGATGFHHAMTHNGRVSDCEFIGRGYDSHFHFSYNAYGAHDLRFERNYFQDCSGPYLRLRAGCHDAVLAGNEFVSTASTNNWPFVELATFNNVEPGDETWGYNFTFTNNTFNFLAAGSPSGLSVSVPIRCVHAGFDPYKSPGVTWKYLLNTNYASVLAGGSPLDKKAVLRVNYGLNYGGQMSIAGNSFPGFHSYYLQLYSYSAPDYNYTNYSGAHICPDYGGDGQYDISDMLTASVIPSTNSWIADASGNWSDASKWNPAGIPNETGSVALLTNNITASRTNTVDALVAVGALEIGSRNGVAGFLINAVGDGSLSFDNSGAGARIVQAAGTDQDAIQSPILLADELTISNAHTLTISGVISELGGARSVTKVGSGQLTLSSSNTFSGGLTINSGTVAVSAASKLGTGMVTLGDTTGANSASIIGSRTVTNTITVAAGSSGTKTLRCSGSSTITFSGRILLNGDLTASSFNTGGSTTLSGVISGPGAVTVTAQNATNIVVLGNANTFGGGVTLASGTLLLGSDDALGTGALLISNGTTLGPNGDSAVAPANPIAVNGNCTLAQAASGTGAITLSGPIDLGVATRTITVTSSNAAISGVISGGSLIKAGPGTLTLNGTNTYTGATVVTNSGALVVNGALGSGEVTVKGGTLGGTGTIGGTVTVSSGATLAPGSGAVGNLSVSNTLTLAAGSTTLMEIDKANGTNDTVKGITALTYGGTLAVTNLSGTFNGGESYKLFSATTYKPGNFSATNLPPLSAGLNWVWTPTNGTLSVMGGVATTPTNLSYSVSGGTLKLAWPGSHAGWYAQSNIVNVADTNRWFDIAGSQAATNLSVTFDPTLTNVFYRLRRP